MTNPVPDTSQQRITIVDALRGFALLGIILAHFTEQFYAGPPPAGHEGFASLQPVDQVVENIVGILVRGKFFMLFSFLFGLSFSIQMNRAESSGVNFRLRFAWRMVILLLIGLAHCLIYRGDILSVYALFGLPLVFFNHLSARTLVITASAIMIGLPRIALAFIPWYTGELENNYISGGEPAYWAAFTGPSLWDMMWHNMIHGLPVKMIYQIGAVSRGYQTFALFLLGLAIGKTGFFENFMEKGRLYRKGLLWSLAGFFGLIAISALLFAVFKLQEKASEKTVMTIGMGLFDVLNLFQTSFYVCAFMLLARRPWWGRQINKLAPVGRMALTAYVSQSLVGIVLYCGIGFGLIGKIGAAASAGIALLVFIAQQLLCRWWLLRYQYGPLEWLWRSATLWQWQPLKRPQASMLS